jgi:hypothetical protein
MSAWSRWLALAVPGGLLGFCWLGMRTDTLAGSESMRSFGFPFPWYAPSPASSQAFDIALGPALMDLLAYVLIATVLLRLLAPSSAGAPRHERAAGLLAWVAAAGSLLFTLTVIGADAHFVGWFLDDYFGPATQHRHAFQFGPGG